MSALVRIDAPHVARSPLLLGGLVLGLAICALALFSTPTRLPLADELLSTYGALALGCGALLAGAWLGLRDRASGAAECLAATPTPVWRRERARMAAAVLAAAGVFALAFALGVGAAALAGNRGVPSLRLALDGMLSVGLSAGVGLLVGRTTHSRVASLFAAVAWFLTVAATSLNFPDARGPTRLAPVVFSEERSAVLGFLPDPYWGHLAYLAGLLLLVGVAVVALVARREDAGVPRLPVTAAGLVAVAVVAVSATWLWSLPEALDAQGPAPADWTAKVLDHSRFVPGPEPYAYPADGLATACAQGTDVEVCVYPAYGEALARQVVAEIQPVVGLLTGLPGVPERIRMVPSSTAPCQAAELQLPEWQVRFGYSGLGAFALLECALSSEGTPSDTGLSAAGMAVRDWAIALEDPSYRAMLRDHDDQVVVVGDDADDPRAEAAAAEFEARFQAGRQATLAMLALPPAQVRAGLEPLWQRLRAGEVELDELPGATP